MYKQHFGFTRVPFALTPDPAFLYPSAKHASALTALDYGLASQAAIQVITGEIGCGKTTLINHILNTPHRTLQVCSIGNTTEATSPIRWVYRSFSLSSASNDPTDMFFDLVRFLEASHASGITTLVVVDEAQNLSIAALEELRCLTNVNRGSDLMLQVILVGQPNLNAKLSADGLRQLVQRISLMYHLEPFNLEETIGYIKHRIAVAGGSEDIFDDYAAAAVHHFANGVPRLINMVCDRALLNAFVRESRAVACSDVVDVGRELDCATLKPLRPAGTEIAPSLERTVGLRIA